MRTIPCTVADRFYPADARELRRRVHGYLAATPAEPPARAIVGIIAPHAGYDYCGRVAGAVYAHLLAATPRTRRVLLLGTWHQRYARGIAATQADAFVTPLGEVEIDHDAVLQAQQILGPQLVIDERAHTADHALQVQLPFLQCVLNQFTVVPLLVGALDNQHVAELVTQLGSGAEHFVVVSSDLSHYHDDSTAQRLDGRTASAIIALEATAIGPAQACGYSAIAGLIVAARVSGWHARLVALANSGQVTGRDERVVGYGSFYFEE